MQETNLYTITVPVLAKTLRALQGVLDKAAAHAETKKTAKRTFEEALLNDRIIFDQLPFSSQVRIACDNAKGGAARLAEVEIPSFEDNEKTFAELKERITKTIAFLDRITPEQVIGKEGVPRLPSLSAAGAAALPLAPSRCETRQERHTPARFRRKRKGFIINL